MLYDIYTAVKTQITAADEDSEIKGIEWYNVQYEGSIANTPRVFIEFPESIQFAMVSKDLRRAPLKLRLHVLTQAISGADGVIADTTAEDHEDIAYLVFQAIDKYTPLKATIALTSPLQLTAWQHFHKHKGWMVTFVEFEGKVVF